jgi:uncharacterized protein (DUF2345 family)
MSWRGVIILQAEKVGLSLQAEKVGLSLQAEKVGLSLRAEKALLIGRKGEPKKGDHMIG